MLTVAALGKPAHAAEDERWPHRPIRLVIPYAAGGGPDTLTRQMLPEVSHQLGVPVVPDNRVGAGGVVAAEHVAQQRADGYTWLLGGVTHVLQKVIQPRISFDVLKDFVHVTRLTATPSVLLVSAQSEFDSLGSLLSLGRRRPHYLNYASGGLGSTSHLAAATLMHYAKVDATHVPYRGSVDLSRALLSGEIHFAIPTVSTAAAMYATGRYRALGVTSDQPLPAFAEAPPLSEVMLTADLVQWGWSGIWLPVGAPPAVTQQIFDVVQTVFGRPEVKQKYGDLGIQVQLSQSPAAFTDFVKSEVRKYSALAQKLRLSF